MHSRAIVLATMVCAVTLTGCMGRADETVQAGGNVDDPPVSTLSPSARFLVEEVAILHLDGSPEPLYEDDAGALIRYVVRQPADASKETAFVTFVLNGRITDVTQVTLEPGASREFERRVGDLRDNRTIDVEVRAGSSSATASAEVLGWPRAGKDTLALGPLRIRIDYGLMEHDGRLLVNVSLENVGPEQPIEDFRAKTLCLLPDGTIRSTNSVHTPAPAAGNATSADVFLDDCGGDRRYGVEFKAGNGADEIVGRLLLVPPEWRPASP